MSTFLGFIRKEFFHIFRDRRTLLILFGMPVVQLILFGYAIRNEINDVQVTIVDQSSDVVSTRLVQKILASPYFEAAEHRHYVGDIERGFRRGTIKEAIVIGPGFAERLQRDGHVTIQILTDATDPNTANTILSYTNAIVTDFARDYQPLAGDAALIIPETRMRFNPELKSVILFVPGLIALILMLVCALMTSITITREKEVGTMEILLVSPLRPSQIIIGKVLPYLALSFLNVVSILVLARFTFNVPVRGSVTLLLAECLLFIVCALALGILISTRTSSQQTAMMISLAGLLLPTVILSGFIFPISSMPDVLQYVSHIVPAKWFLRIIRGIMIKGVGIEYVWKETLILTGMTLAFLVISVRNFKIRL
ncbi:MAG: ABC transporter permease [Rhodothermales bacterium]|nr:ABC transporter permease [Rhodothermales bacterium]